MKTDLNSVAELQPGVYIKTVENAKDKAYLLGIKDFDENFNLIQPSAEVDKNVVREKYIVQKDHVLFSTRLKFNAFKLPTSKDVYVASNSFMLIKPDTKKVKPDYLRWFLNHPNTQQEFLQLQQGSSRMPYIGQKKLGEIQINLPKMSIQKEISTIYDIFNKEKDLTQKLISKKEQYVQSLLLKTSKK